MAQSLNPIEPSQIVCTLMTKLLFIQISEDALLAFDQGGQFNFYSIEFENRMKDEQLYSLIKKAVRQRKNVLHHSQTQNFAQRYCQNQLKRKIYNYRDKGMGEIMKKFNRLETYYDLPELVREIRQLKKKEIDQTRIKSIKRIEIPEQPLHQIKKSGNKPLWSWNNLRASIQRQYSKKILDSIDNNSLSMSQKIKNNSSLHMTNLQTILKSCNQDAHGQNPKLFQNLQRFLKNEKEFIQNQQSQSSNKKKINAEEKKEATEYLHKISSYLQIILEKEHKHKWKRKRSSSLFKPNNAMVKKYKKSQHSYLNPSKTTILITESLSNLECIQTLKQQTRMIKEEQKNLQKPKYILKKPKSSFYKQNMSQKNSFRDLNSNLSNNQTCHTNTEDSVSLIRKQNSLIKQNFTFRRRSIKQKIIKKLDKFIGEIDDETFTSKKENGYYKYQINKLENSFKRLYGRYRKATLADQKEIQNLKRLAQQFSMTTGIRKGNSNESDSQLTSEQLLSSKDAIEHFPNGNSNVNKNGSDLFNTQLP